MVESQDDRIDRMLKEALADVERPAPSASFDGTLRIALVEERRRRRAAQARMRVMQIYWLFAGLACLAIVAKLSWHAWPDNAWLPLLAVTAVVAIPTALVRVDLVDLILNSGERLRGQLF